MLSWLASSMIGSVQRRHDKIERMKLWFSSEVTTLVKKKTLVSLLHSLYWVSNDDKPDWILFEISKNENKLQHSKEKIEAKDKNIFF